MGAVVNMRPDLFKAVVSKVPFVDVINTMLDESLPLTVGEFEEWGNPQNEGRVRLHEDATAPTRTWRRKAYPAMLVKTSFNDSQVMYWEPAKYVAQAADAQDRRRTRCCSRPTWPRATAAPRPLRLPARDRVRLRVHPDAARDRAVSADAHARELRRRALGGGHGARCRRS